MKRVFHRIISSLNYTYVKKTCISPLKRAFHRKVQKCSISIVINQMYFCSLLLYYY